jgi:Fe2+ or Zn2+ uptake regulation protein
MYVVAMKARTRDEVMERYKRVYCEDGVWKSIQPQDKRISSSVIYRALKTLPEDASVEQIDQAIGNYSWTLYGHCACCEKPVTEGLLIGRDDFPQFLLCFSCAKVVRELTK